MWLSSRSASKPLGEQKKFICSRSVEVGGGGAWSSGGVVNGWGSGRCCHGAGLAAHLPQSPDFTGKPFLTLQIHRAGSVSEQAMRGKAEDILQRIFCFLRVENWGAESRIYIIQMHVSVAVVKHGYWSLRGWAWGRERCACGLILGIGDGGLPCWGYEQVNGQQRYSTLRHRARARDRW